MRFYYAQLALEFFVLPVATIIPGAELLVEIVPDR